MNVWQSFLHGFMDIISFKHLFSRMDCKKSLEDDEENIRSDEENIRSDFEKIGQDFQKIFNFNIFE